MERRPARLFVIVGLPGAGKTTRARQLASEHGALRLTPDDWMIPLFHHNDADGKRDVLEGRFVWLAMQALRGGLDVALDFGVWGRDERSALKCLAAAVGATCELVYLPVDHAEQLRRVTRRFESAPGSTFPMSEEDLIGWRGLFQEPDAHELSTADPGPPPVGFTSWESWVADRWPTAMES